MICELCSGDVGWRIQISCFGRKAGISLVTKTLFLLHHDTVLPTTMQSSKAALPQSFIAKKKQILDQLSVPASEYDDLSPKGSIDVGIRDLIDEINQIEGCVTTSSCSGRVSVFLEGKRRFEEESRAEPGEKEGGDGKVVEDQMDVSGDAGEVRETTAGVGGKGGGGRWLYVSHTEVAVDQHGHVGGLAGLLGMEPLHDDPPRDAARRYIHFKFEPMVSSRTVDLVYPFF